MCWLVTPYRRCDLQVSFSHSIGCLSVLSMVSFAVRKFSVRRGVPLVYLHFCLPFSLESEPQKPPLRPVFGSRALPCSSLRFTVSCLTFKSIILVPPSSGRASLPQPVSLQGLLFNVASGQLKAPEKPAAMPFTGKCHLLLPLARLERMAGGETAWGHIMKGLACPQGGDMAQRGHW